MQLPFLFALPHVLFLYHSTVELTEIIPGLLQMITFPYNFSFCCMCRNSKGQSIPLTDKGKHTNIQKLFPSFFLVKILILRWYTEVFLKPFVTSKYSPRIFSRQQTIEYFPTCAKLCGNCSNRFFVSNISTLISIIDYSFAVLVICVITPCGQRV